MKFVSYNFGQCRLQSCTEFNRGWYLIESVLCTWVGTLLLGFLINKICALNDQPWGQGGWILAKFFFAFLLTKTNSKSIKHAQKKWGQYTAILTMQAWLIRDLLFDCKENFYLWNQCRKSWTGKMSLLPTQVANQNAGFAS